jgi:predicted O-methyltransferase YrrM
MSMRAFKRWASRGYQSKYLQPYRSWHLRRLVARLARTPASDHTRQRLLHKIARTWGNNSWSATEAILDSLLHWLDESSGPVLECGSGVSTLVLVAGVSPTTRRLVSLEHQSDWAKRVWDGVPRHMRANLEMVVRPLVSWGEYDWYDVDVTSLPESIGFVFCDGPPGNTRGGRIGITPVLRDRLAPGALVLFDDTSRPAEREIVDLCCAELPADLIEDAPRHSTIRVSG